MTALAAPPRSIAVFRALHVGDLLCAVPALRSLRAWAPDAHIALIGLDWAHRFVARFGAYLDEFIAFPGYPGFPERDAPLAHTEAFLAAMRARGFDLAVQLHGTGYEVNALLLGAGAAATAGFHPPDQTPPGAHFIPWAERGHEIERLRRLPLALGAPDSGRHLEFPLDAADRQPARRLQQRHALTPGDYVCLHVGSRLPSRRWPLERFAAVAEAIVGAGHPLVLTGTEGERPLVERLVTLMSPAARSRAAEVVGQTTLGSLAALVAEARLVVSNDTGLMHVAAAVGCASVIVCSGGDAERWAPLDRSRHTVFAHPVPCRPCAHVECPIGHPCALGTETDAVIAAVRAALAPPPSLHAPHPEIAHAT